MKYILKVMIIFFLLFYTIEAMEYGKGTPLSKTTVITLKVGIS